MGRPTVSVLMNCLNGARFLKEALDSVVAQTYTDWEVIFWDDASTDESAAIAKGYGTKVKYFSGLGGKTLGQSRNLAVAQAAGRYLAILDCDDWWKNEKLRVQVHEMDEHRDMAFYFSECQIIDEHNAVTGTAFMRTAPPGINESLYRALLTHPNFMLCPTIMFRTAAVRKAGGFRPQFGSAEIYDLCVRLSQHSLGGYTYDALAVHRRHPGQFNGAGKAATYREVLTVMGEHRAGASWPQYVREATLWGKYLVKKMVYENP